MKDRAFVALLLTLLVLFASCGYSESQPAYTDSAPEVQLSDTCDYILCKGTDTSGNTYELVASQDETALGYEITVGIIKNNTWLVPMSSDSPFLGGDGLFPIEDGTDLGTVVRARIVARHFYFVDSGSFFLEYYDFYGGDVRIIFDCNTQQAYEDIENTDKHHWLYRFYELKTKGSSENYDVISYGKILTDDNLILLYKDVSDSSDWNKPKEYDWLLLDTATMELHTIASNMVGITPQCALSEGLFFASDDCFYNIYADKVIDLSMYDIDTWEHGGLYFRDGECTFIAENDLGTEFEITIDTLGRVLSEIKR